MLLSSWRLKLLLVTTASISDGAMAQSFSFNNALDFTPDGIVHSPGSYSGTFLIDPGAGTLSVNGTLSVPAMSWTSVQTVSTTVVTPHFPYPPTSVTYTDTLTVSYQSTASTSTYNYPTQTPSLAGPTSYSVTDSGGPQLSVSFSYKLVENGTTITTGTGGYGLLPDIDITPFTVNVKNYPKSVLGTIGPNQGPDWIAGELYITGHDLVDGPRFSVAGPHASFGLPPIYTISSGLVPVPEPTACVLGSGVAALCFAISRRFHRRRNS